MISEQWFFMSSNYVLAPVLPSWMTQYALAASVVTNTPGLLTLLGLLFPCAALLSAISLAGTAVLPLLAIFRGLIFGCGSNMLVSATDGGYLMALLVLGLPAMFTVPFFLVLCGVSTDFSRTLRLRGRGRALSAHQQPLRWFLCCAALSPVQALVEIYAVPFLVSLI